MRVGLGVISVFFLLSGAAMIYGAGDLGGAVTLGDAGPGRVPTFCGWAIVLLSAALLVRVARDRPQPLAFPQLPRAAAMAAAGLAYVALLPVAGYYAATTIFLFPILRLLKASWLAAAGVTVGFLVFVFLVFDKLLGVPLP
jgi:putative tricarboxylic transport membrane protein